ncbi:MAG: hypothetical protein ACFFAA_03805, partial [Promethearchaeota archaeon]
MAINKIKRSKSRRLGILWIFISLILIAPLLTNSFQKSHSYKPFEKNPIMSAPSDVLVDKVYNFTVGRPFVYFNENLYFERLYNFYITLCIVTPHTCSMNITLWDPEGDEYRLSHEKNMTQNDYREIPYGVAISGNFSILFRADLTENLNIHINIERGGR